MAALKQGSKTSHISEVLFPLKRLRRRWKRDPGRNTLNESFGNDSRPSARAENSFIHLLNIYWVPTASELCAGARDEKPELGRPCPYTQKACRRDGERGMRCVNECFATAQ